MNLTQMLPIVLVTALAANGATADEKPQDNKQLNSLIGLLGEIDDPAFQLDILKGVNKALNGRRDVELPAAWKKVSPKLYASKNDELRQRALRLGVIFGDPNAMQVLRETAADRKRKVAQREESLQPLVQKRDAKTLPLLYALLNEPAMRSAAIRFLAGYNDESTAARLLKLYPKLSDAEKRDAVLTLASRPKWALQLLAAVESKSIPSRDVSAFVVRQMSTFNNKQVTARIRQVWGDIRPTAKDRAQRIAAYKKKLSADVLKKANLPNGRLQFHKTCAACHRLYDDGKRIGPELTGSQRSNLDYLLENLLDPNAVIGRDYRMSVIATDTGRILTGIIKEETAKTITLQTANEQVIIPKADIEVRKRSTVSLMPDGQLEKMGFEEARDLIAYLMSREQVELPKAESGKRKAGGAERRSE